VKLEELKEQKEVYKRYLQACFDREDWHGVSDAANDIREIEVQLRMVCGV